MFKEATRVQRPLEDIQAEKMQKKMARDKQGDAELKVAKLERTAARKQRDVVDGLKPANHQFGNPSPT
jgi:hypothetical protein